MFSPSLRGILWALLCCLAACKEKPAAATQPAVAQYSLERPLEGLPAPAPRDANFRRGVSLELFVAEVEGEAERAAYTAWLDQATRLGATDLELVVQWSQLNATAVEMAPSESSTVDDGFLGWLMDQAAARDLRVLLTPVIEVERPSGERVLDPADHKRWFWSYHRFALHYARIAEAHGACCFGVGSDLPALETQDEAHWRELIADVRKAFKGKLGYTARVDRLDAVKFWDALELAGVLGAGEPSAGAPREAEEKLAERLRSFRKTHAPALLLTRFAGVPGGADERARLDSTRALYRALQAEPQLSGVYVSLAGPGVSPQASASAEVMRHWYIRSRK